MGRGFQTVQGRVEPGTERGVAGLAAKGLDALGTAMLAIADEGVLPKDMVDNSTSRFQTHFGPVFRDEAVQRDLLFPEPGSIRGFLRVSSPVSP
jgi:hypothetical protein